MPVPRDLEDAVSQLQKANQGMSRADALNLIHEGISSGDSAFTQIPNIQSDLHAERVQNFAGAALSGFLRTFTSPGEFLTREALSFAPKNTRQTFEPLIEGATQTEKELESRSPGGSMVGSLGAFLVPGGPSEVERLPLVSKLPAVVRGAVTGGLQGAIGSLGDQTNPFTGKPMSPTAAGAIFGAGGDVLGKTWDLIAGRMAKAGSEAAKAESVLAPEDLPGAE